MKITTLAGLALASVSLCACAGMPIGGMTQGAQSWSDAAIQIAKDPACGHTDSLDVMLGAIPSGHIHLERDCPKPGDAAKATPPSAPAQPAGQ